MQDFCFAAKNEYVLRNVTPLQWTASRAGT